MPRQYPPGRIRSAPASPLLPRSALNRFNQLGGPNDQLTLLTAAAGRDLTVQAGGGNDTTLLSQIRTGRHLSILNFENEALQNISSAGTLTIRTSNASTNTFIDRMGTGRLGVTPGAGDDRLSPGERTLFAATV